MLKIKVPATTANLGPAFDSMAIALNIYNEFIFTPQRKMAFIGFPPEYSDEFNLLYKVYRNLFMRNHKTLYPVAIELKQALPTSGGFGSSATAIIAAVIAYMYFNEIPIKAENIIKEALYYEEHPDNIVAAVMGGVCGVARSGDEIIWDRFDIHPSWNIYFLIPYKASNTEESRKVLPSFIPLNDVVYNMSRSILIPQALKQGSEEMLFKLMDDLIHQPYRIPLIKGAKEIFAFATKYRYPCFLSGAGSSIAIMTRRQFVDEFPNWQRRKLSISKSGTTFN